MSQETTTPAPPGAPAPVDDRPRGTAIPMPQADPVRLVARIVENLVDHPSYVHVRRRITPHEITLVVRIAPSDMPLVIGRHGRTARAIRNLLVRFKHRDPRRYRLTFQPGSPATA